MNMMEVNTTALKAATAAVAGKRRTKLIDKVYEAIDRAERSAYEEAFDDGVKFGQDEMDTALNFAVQNGKNDAKLAYDQGREDGWNKGWGAGAASYDAGYKQARRDLGECPMVDDTFDVEYDC